MAHLTTVGALHLGPVLGLGAVAREMTLLLAVAAGDHVGVARLITLLRDVIFGAAVTARTSFGVGTLLKDQMVSTTTRTVLRTGDTYVAREVALLVALAAFDTFGRARLSAVGSLVAFLLAVLAGKRVDTLLRAVAGTMTFLLAIDASNGWGRFLALSHLFLAVLLDVAKLSTVGAQGYTAVNDKTSRLESLHILGGISRPALGELDTARLGALLEGKDK